MIKLLIATRNRPVALGNVLDFLERFYPQTNVIVADGSAEQSKAAVQALCKSYKTLPVDFRSYPYEMSYYDRVIDVLEGEDDEFVAMGADDDFPLIDAFQRGKRFLQEHSDYSLAVGGLLIFDLTAPGELSARYRPARPINHEEAVGRVRQYGNWPSPLSYALCRRELLIDRYRETRSCEMGEVVDLWMGLTDCLAGKVHALPEIGVVLTRNFNHSYTRAGSKLEFLDRGPQLAAMIRQVQQRLLEAGTLDSDQAAHLATDLFSRHIGSYLTGIPFHMHKRFIDSNIHLHEFIREQFSMFEKLFQSGTSEHQRYKERLTFIANALNINAGINKS